MEEEQDVEVGDDTPPIKEQARLNGWRAEIFDFGKAEQEGVSYFNPSLIRRPDGLWLITRRSVDEDGMIYGRNDLCAFKLENLKPTIGYPLKVPDSDAQQQFEDPRAFRWGEQTWIGMVNFTWYADGSWTGAHQCLASYRDDEEWTPIVRRDPPVETNQGQAGHTNGRHNKNFLWFIHEGQLHLVYSSDPWHVVAFGATWEEQKHYRGDGVKWKYGHIRGGTTPVLVGDKYFTFFHSSVPWRGRYRRYYMGALAFEAAPPFKPVLVSLEPMLIGSQNDFWHQRKPLVVFPCGALLEGDTWLVTFGVNDLKSGYALIPHEDVVKSCQEPPQPLVAALLGQITTQPVYERIQADPIQADPMNVDLPLEFPRLTTKPDGLTSDELEQFAKEMIEKEAKNTLIVDGVPQFSLDPQKTKRQIAAAKARAALAAKRATGWRPKKKRRMKRRKRKELIQN